MFFAEGDVVAGRYRIKSRIARGGMGMIYDAVQENLDRRVALKMILPTLVDNPVSATRFRREVEIAQALSHRNIIEIYDFGDDNGMYWVAMEFLEGADLESYLRTSGPLPYSKVVGFTRQTLEALAMAHRLGVVHRDIKPSNIFVEQLASGEEVVKVLDFGVAKSMDDDSNLTGTGNICGSTAYMAPEMLLLGEITLSADVYALGLVMLEMLVAARAVRGSAIGKHVDQHTRGRIDLPEPFSNTPLEGLIRKACAKQVEERFLTASEMLEALNSLPSPSDPEARTPTHLADAFRLEIDPDASWDRKGNSDNITRESEPIRIDSDVDEIAVDEEPEPMIGEVRHDASAALEAGESYDPEVYFELDEEGSSEQSAPVPDLSIGEDVRAIGEDVRAPSREDHLYDEPASSPDETLTTADASVPRSKKTVVRVVAIVGIAFLVLNAVIFSAIFVLEGQAPLWEKSENVAQFVKESGWTLAPGQIIESDERRVERWTAFKGAKSAKIEFHHCSPLSDCEPSPSDGNVLEAENFWIKTVPGPGGLSPEYENLVDLLMVGPTD